jgi:hypothetical protein
MNTSEGTTMLMNMSRAIAAAAAGAIVLGAVGLQPAAADGIPMPGNPGSPEGYQNVNPSPPGGYGYGYPPPPAVYGYRAPPPVMYGYPVLPRVYGPPGPFIGGPYRGPRFRGPVYGGYPYRGFAYGGPGFIARGPYWRYGPY